MSGDPIVWALNALRRRMDAALSARTLAAIDLGEHAVTCLVFQADRAALYRAINNPDRDPHAALPIIGASRRPSVGIEQGVIVDQPAAAKSIVAALDEANRLAGVSTNRVVFSLSGGTPRTLLAEGLTEIATRRVDDNSVARVLAACRPEISSRVRRPIHIDLIDFERDGISGLRDPRGVAAARLGVNIAVTTLERAALDALAQTARLARVQISGVVASAISSGFAVLTDDERELGAISVDFGAGTTGIAAFKDGRHSRAEVLPLGGNALTRDLAEALEISTLAAEAHKVGRGEGLVAADPSILGGAGPGEVQSVHVGVVRPRLAETMEMVSMRLDELPGRPVVLTGGGSQLPGIVDFAETILQSRVRAGAPFRTVGSPSVFRGPDCAAAHGVASYIIHLITEPWRDAISMTAGPDRRLSGLTGWLRENW